jgi:hypothetical protein
MNLNLILTGTIDGCLNHKCDLKEEIKIINDLIKDNVLITDITTFRNKFINNVKLSAIVIITNGMDFEDSENVCLCSETETYAFNTLEEALKAMDNLSMNDRVKYVYGNSGLYESAYKYSNNADIILINKFSSDKNPQSAILNNVITNFNTIGDSNWITNENNIKYKHLILEK